MNKEKNETTPKERIVVIEKGKAIDIGPLAVCCAVSLFPFRAYP